MSTTSCAVSWLFLASPASRDGNISSPAQCICGPDRAVLSLEVREGFVPPAYSDRLHRFMEARGAHKTKGAVWAAYGSPRVYR